MSYSHIFCSCPPRVRIPSVGEKDPVKNMALTIGREVHRFCKECGKLKGEPEPDYEYFLLKKEHIAILQEGNIQEGETGFPAFGEKRPLGNSHPLYDIANLLGYETTQEDGDTKELTPEQILLIKSLIRDLPKALTIILRTKSFVPGYYRAKKYNYGSWEILT